MIIRLLLYPLYTLLELAMLAAAVALIIIEAVGSIASAYACRAATWLTKQAQRLPDPAWYVERAPTTTEPKDKP